MSNILRSLESDSYYSEIALLNDMRHLKNIHCNDNKKLRLKKCTMNVNDCPFINDKNHSRFCSVINQMHILLAHTNKRIEGFMRDKFCRLCLTPYFLEEEK